MEEPQYRHLMDYALRALTRRSHTTHELKQKLQKRRTYTKPLGQQVLDRLLELGLLNDEDLIRRRVEEGARVRLEGPLKVASRLFKKGIPIKKTKEAWEALQVSEKELAQAALKRAEKRFHRLPKEKRYRRQVQFLASRGFSSGVIYEVVKEVK